MRLEGEGSGAYSGATEGGVGYRARYVVCNHYNPNKTW